MNPILAAAFFCLLCSMPASAEVYRYVDADGVLHYTNVQPGRAASHPAPASKPAGKAPAPAPAASPRPASASTQAPQPAGVAKGRKEYCEEVVTGAAKRYGLDPTLVHAVVKVESGYDPYAVSRKGARGLMQLMPETAADMNVTNSWDIHQNVDGGVRYLRTLMERFNGNEALALAAYNAGPSTVERHGGIPPYAETKNYVEKVFSLSGRKPAAGGAGIVKTVMRPEPAKPAEEKEEKIERIYRILMEDGTILYTNTPPPMSRKEKPPSWQPL